MGEFAIASVAPILHDADADEISIAMATVFLFNAVALFIFPSLGNIFHLINEAYGYFCAIAIHDTSSVVGAASFGSELALETAVLVKLGRALLIIPMVLISSSLIGNKSEKSKK